MTRPERYHMRWLVSGRESQYFAGVAVLLVRASLARSFLFSFSLCTYIYIYIHTCIYIYIYTYIHMYITHLAECPAALFTRPADCQAALSDA